MTDTETATRRPQWRTLIERYGAQALNVVLSVFLVVFLVTYVSGQRETTECQGHVNAAIIESLKARGTATAISDRAFDDLLSGLRSPGANVDGLIRATQAARAQAAAIRTDNPYPNPNC